MVVTARHDGYSQTLLLKGQIGRPTSSSISVLLYSRWCRSMTEELCSLASGDRLLQKCAKSRAGKSHDHVSVSWSRTQKVLTLSDRGCWSLCGQYHGRIQQRPWRRHRGQSSTSSAYQSVGEKKDKFIRGEQNLAEAARKEGIWCENSALQGAA